MLHENICFQSVYNVLKMLPVTPHCLFDSVSHFPHSWYQLSSPAVCFSWSSTFFESRYSVILIPLAAPELMPLVFSRMRFSGFSSLTCIFEAPGPVCLFQESPLPILWIQPPPIHQHFTHTLSWNISIFIGMASSFVAYTELPILAPGMVPGIKSYVL